VKGEFIVWKEDFGIQEIFQGNSNTFGGFGFIKTFRDFMIEAVGLIIVFNYPNMVISFLFRS